MTTAATTPRSLGLIHTVASLVTTFDELAAELAAPVGVTTTHLVDEALLAATRRDGLTKSTARHLFAYAVATQESGADAILVTCSSIGPAVDAIAPLIDVPVVRVDEAMAAQAVAIGGRVGVLATLESTMRPTGELVVREARASGRPVEVEMRLCAGAFDAARAGDRERHDRLVEAELRALLPVVDVVLLAQASMARALAGIAADELRVPVLTSPRSAMERALAVLREAASGATAAAA